MFAAFQLRVCTRLTSLHSIDPDPLYDTANIVIAIPPAVSGNALGLNPVFNVRLVGQPLFSSRDLTIGNDSPHLAMKDAAKPCLRLGEAIHVPLW